MGGRPTSPRQIATVAFFTLSCFCLILFVWVQFGGTVPLAPHGYRFHAVFNQAPNLATNEEVRIAGVPVGKVVSVTPRGGLTDATLELRPQYAPLASDSRVILRSKTLLGENFVSLAPGSSGAPKLAENGYLSTANVDPTQQIDQVLGAFDPPTRTAFKRLLAEVGTALHGRGADLNAALGNSGPTLDNLNQIVGILDSQGANLQLLIRDTGVALRALGSRSSDLQTVATAGNQVFAATAARNRELTATIKALPAFLAQLRPTLSAVQVSAGYAAPTLHTLRPVAPLVPPVLREVNQLAPKLTALFHRVGPLIDIAKRAVPAAIDLVHALKPVADSLDPALRQLVPVVQYFTLFQKESIATVANTGTTTEATIKLPNGDQQHYARVTFPLNDQILVGQSLVGPDDRHNAYPVPGYLNRLATGLRALDCNNLGNPPALLGIFGTSTPPCILQEGFNFQGVSQQFPHVQPFTP